MGVLAADPLRDDGTRDQWFVAVSALAENYSPSTGRSSDSRAGTAWPSRQRSRVAFPPTGTHDNGEMEKAILSSTRSQRRGRPGIFCYPVDESSSSKSTGVPCLSVRSAERTDHQHTIEGGSISMSPGTVKHCRLEAITPSLVVANAAVTPCVLLHMRQECEPQRNQRQA